MRDSILIFVVVLCSAVLLAAPCGTAKSAAVPDGGSLLEDSGIPGGICVVAGSSDAELPIALARATNKTC